VRRPENPKAPDIFASVDTVEEARSEVLKEIDRAEEAAASSLATDNETGEVDEEAQQQFRRITRLMGDMLRGQLCGKSEMKGTPGDSQ